MRNTRHSLEIGTQRITIRPTMGAWEVRMWNGKRLIAATWRHDKADAEAEFEFAVRIARATQPVAHGLNAGYQGAP